MININYLDNRITKTVLKFVDVYGVEGRIREDFSVEYEGRTDIEPFVESVVRKTETNEEAIHTLIATGPDELQIAGIRRTGDTTE